MEQFTQRRQGFVCGRSLGDIDSCPQMDEMEWGTLEEEEELRQRRRGVGRGAGIRGQAP